MFKLDRILKSRGISLPTKVHLVKAKLVLEKAEEPEIKLPTSNKGSYSQGYWFSSMDVRVGL